MSGLRHPISCYFFLWCKMILYFMQKNLYNSKSKKRCRTSSCSTSSKFRNQQRNDYFSLKNLIFLWWCQKNMRHIMNKYFNKNNCGSLKKRKFSAGPFRVRATIPSFEKITFLTYLDPFFLMILMARSHALPVWHRRRVKLDTFPRWRPAGHLRPFFFLWQVGELYDLFLLYRSMGVRKF